MVDETIDLIFVIKPKPGKHQMFIDLFNACAEYARDNEPGTTRYYIQRQKAGPGSDDLLVARETYENAEALKHHSRSPPVIAIMKMIRSGEGVESSQLISLDPQGTGYERGVPKLKL